MTNNIAIPRDEIADFCLRHHIRKLAFFGSVIRDDFGPDSDMDLLVIEQGVEHVRQESVRLRQALRSG